MSKLCICTASVVLFAFAAACSNARRADERGGERAATLKSALTGGDTHDVSSSPALPEIAVGTIATTAKAQCTATVLQRRGPTGGAILITAAHCFCTVGIETPKEGTTFTLRGAFLGTSVKTVTKFFGSAKDACPPDPDPDTAISDLAIVTLDRPIDAATVPSVPRVYTGADFLNRVYDLPPPIFTTAPLITSTLNGEFQAFRQPDLE